MERLGGEVNITKIGYVNFIFKQERACQQSDIDGGKTQKAQPFIAKLFSPNTFRKNVKYHHQFLTHW